MKYLLCLALLICAAATETASATAPNTWILCDTCQSKPDFNNAALIWYGNRTYRTAVEVGNPITGVLYTVHIEYNNGGDPVGWEGDDTVADSPPSVEIFQLPNGGRIVASTDESKEGINAFPPTGYPYVSSSFHDTANEPDFIDAVASVKVGVLLPADEDHIPAGTPGFDSFVGFLPEWVCPKLHDAMTEAHPGWGSSSRSLISALKAWAGHGPSGGVVFRNGDTASFQLNPTQPSACVYKKDSARDRDNNPIPDDGMTSVGGGGGDISVDPNHNGNPVLTGYTSAHDHWLICSFQGNTLLGCYIE